MVVLVENSGCRGNREVFKFFGSDDGRTRPC